MFKTSQNIDGIFEESAFETDTVKQPKKKKPKRKCSEQQLENLRRAREKAKANRERRKREKAEAKNIPIFFHKNIVTSINFSQNPYAVLTETLNKCLSQNKLTIHIADPLIVIHEYKTYTKNIWG